VTGKEPLTDKHEELVSSERPDDFNYGIGKTKALYLPFDGCYPRIHVLDRGILSVDAEAKHKKEAPEGAIDFDMQVERVKIRAGSIVVATGWQPYDATKIDNLGFGRFPNVITNVMMERYAALSGPTQGKIVRPSDNEPPQNVAFVQCAGSRDENHLPYCSAVCCMGSLKQARYVREKCPDANITIFYIDIRVIGYLEKFYYDLLDDEKIRFVKGKVADIQQDASTGNLKLDVEDSLEGEKFHDTFDLVVLAVGVVPNTAISKLPIKELQYDSYGFIPEDTEGIFAVGCARRPADVSRSTKDATGAALKAIQVL